MLALADLALDAFHILVIAINCFFWMVPGWPRRLFLLVFSLTVVSWLGLGYWYGWGYCFLTDIHWDIKRSVGAVGLPYSYVTYLINLLGFYPHPKLVDQVVAGVFVFLFLVYLHLLYSKFSGRFKSPRSS